MVLECFSTIGSIVENVATEKFQNNKGITENSLKKANNLSSLVNPLVNAESYSSMELLGIILVLIIFTLPAVVIAVRCNTKSPVLMGIVAFLFDRIYLFQHVVRKYLLREKGYCKNITVN